MQTVWGHNAGDYTSRPALIFTEHENSETSPIALIEEAITVTNDGYWKSKQQIDYEGMALRFVATICDNVMYVANMEIADYIISEIIQIEDLACTGNGEKGEL